MNSGNVSLPPPMGTYSQISTVLTPVLLFGLLRSIHLGTCFLSVLHLVDREGQTRWDKFREDCPIKLIGHFVKGYFI